MCGLNIDEFEKSYATKEVLVANMGEAVIWIHSSKEGLVYDMLGTSSSNTINLYQYLNDNHNIGQKNPNLIFFS